MNRSGQVFFNESMAGIIAEDETGYHFTYSEKYLRSEDARPVSLTMPLRSEAYSSSVMLPFFDGLIPEGWLLDIASENWKIDPRDRMGLLLTCCADCIGAISVRSLRGGA